MSNYILMIDKYVIKECPFMNNKLFLNKTIKLSSS